MNTSELVAHAQLTATIDSTSAEYSASVVTQLLNNSLRSYFEPLLEQVRSGRWLHTLTRTLSSGNPYVRLHPRACALESIDLRRSPGGWVPYYEAIESEEPDWDPNASDPQVYVVRGNTIVLIPAPTTSDLELRAKCTIRPSQLVTEQAAGRVTSVDTTTRTITVSSLPVDRLNGDATISGTLVIDCIEPRGDFELSLFDASAAVTSSTTVVVDPGPSLSRIEVGDYLRVAGQTDWPQLPESYHNVLAEVAAVTICRQRDMYDRAQELGAAAGAAAQRFIEYLTPRTRAQNRTPIQHGWR